MARRRRLCRALLLRIGPATYAWGACTLSSSAACALQDEEDHHDHQADIEAELGIEIDREEHHGAHPMV